MLLWLLLLLLLLLLLPLLLLRLLLLRGGRLRHLIAVVSLMVVRRAGRLQQRYERQSKDHATASCARVQGRQRAVPGCQAPHSTLAL